MHQQSDFFGATHSVERFARDTGISTAASHAERVTPGWKAGAYAFFVDFVAVVNGSFMAEDVRLAADAAGLPKPPDGRAWGIVVTMAARAKLIRRIGYGPQKAIGCHMAPKTIWIRNGKASRA